MNTDGDGEVCVRYSYGSYGGLTESTGDVDTPFLYNGQYGVMTDANGLYYMRARYYSPVMKRFVNADPIRGSIDDLASPNRYAYANGNPISYIDPFGTSAELNYAAIGHFALDCLGFVPIAGAIFDAANGVWYMAAGDYVSGTFCLVAAAPGVGDAAAAGKMGYKVIKAGAEASKEIKVASKVGKEVKAGENVVAELAGGACFVSGTPVKTEDGSKDIEEIAPGDRVYAKNTDTGETGYKEVVRVFEKETDELVHLKFGDTGIDTTPNHPFWVNGYGFREAGELQEGDEVETAEVSFVEIPYCSLAKTNEHMMSGSPVAVISTSTLKIEITNNISDSLLSRIIREVSHA